MDERWRRRAAIPAIALVALAMPAGGATLAVEASDEVVVADEAPLRLGGRPVRGTWLAVSDGLGDVIDVGGGPIIEYDASADVLALHVTETRLDRRTSRWLNGNRGFGARDTWRSREADQLGRGDRVIVAVVDLAGPLPRRPDGDVHLIIGTDGGDAAWPVTPGGFSSSDAGNRVVTVNGIFGSDDGPRFLAGATDLAGQDPSSTPDRFNAPYRAIGWITDGRDRLVHIQRVIGRPTTISVRLETEAGDRRLVDSVGSLPRLALTTTDPGVPLTCASIGVTPSGPGPVEPADPSRLELILEGGGVSGIAVDRPFTVELTPSGGTEPVELSGRVDTYEAIDTAVIGLDLDRDAFPILTSEDVERLLVSAAPELVLDARRLVGSGGLAMGGDALGVAAGDPRCGRLRTPARLCEAVAASGLPALLGTTTGDIDTIDLPAPDGTRLCVGVPREGVPVFVVGVSDRPYDADDFDRFVGALDGTVTPIALGAGGVRLRDATGDLDSVAWWVDLAEAGAEPYGPLVSIDVPAAGGGTLPVDLDALAAELDPYMDGFEPGTVFRTLAP